MSRDSRTVVVFGATSYLGEFLLAKLINRGDRVHAVVRNPTIADILLHRFAGAVTVSRALEVPLSQADAVVNLAYVKQPVPVGLLRKNANLISSVTGATARLRAPRLLHVSSAAVFGYDLRRPPVPQVAPRLTGDSYVELKIHAERRLLAETASQTFRPVVIRPGNILGPNSPVWVAGPAQRILEGRPVTVSGIDGFSNATYAENLADYLSHLVRAPDEQLATFGTYHHLAEFSDVRWSVFFRAFAHTIGLELVEASGWQAPGRPPLAAVAAGRALRAYAGAVGRWTRRLLGHLPSPTLGDRLYLALKTGLAGRSLAPGGFAEPRDRNYLTIVSAAHEFRSHVLDDWHAPIDLTRALEEMRNALTSGGYAPGISPASRQ